MPKRHNSPCKHSRGNIRGHIQGCEFSNSCKPVGTGIAIYSVFLQYSLHYGYPSCRNAIQQYIHWMLCFQCSSCLSILCQMGFHADEMWLPGLTALFTPTSCVASLSLLNSSLFCRSLSIILLYKSISSFSRRLVSSSLSDMRCFS